MSRSPDVKRTSQIQIITQLMIGPNRDIRQPVTAAFNQPVSHKEVIGALPLNSRLKVQGVSAFPRLFMADSVVYPPNMRQDEACVLDRIDLAGAVRFLREDAGKYAEESVGPFSYGQVFPFNPKKVGLLCCSVESSPSLSGKSKRIEEEKNG
jgi:hypothetical protein